MLEEPWPPAEIRIGDRRIGSEHPPFIIAEIGINHGGDVSKALKMIQDVADAGGECVKIQTHVVEDEMVPNDVIPGNAEESIWEIMSRCSLTEEEEEELKGFAEARDLIFLSTPMSRAAAIRVEALGVAAFKIGSGECNNYPLVRHIANYGKPVILSTGMNDIRSIKRAVDILRSAEVPFALLHCTSIYPTPPEKVRLGALKEISVEFPDAVVGLSDHSLTIYPSLAAIPLGASILERHFTSDKNWVGPDMEISMSPAELKTFLDAGRIIHKSLGCGKTILPEEQQTMDFAYACVVAIRDIKSGELLTEENIWVKRPGTGEIFAAEYEELLGRRATVEIEKDAQLRWDWVAE